MKKTLLFTTDLFLNVCSFNGLLENLKTKLSKKVFMTFLTVLGFTVGLFAQANFVINPSLTEVEIGDTFTVMVVAQTSNSQQVDVAEVHLLFNNSILNVVGLNPLGTSAGLPFEFDQTFNNVGATGTIDYVAGTFSNFPIANFNFLEIEFEAIESGQASLDFVLAPVFPATTFTFNSTAVIGTATGAAVTVGAINTPPIADFEATPGTGPQSLEVFFDAGNSDDSDGTIVSYTWDFGDASPSQNGSTLSHTYANAGTYQVELTIEDDGGLTDVITKSVTVTATIDTPPTIDPIADVQILEGGVVIANIQVNDDTNPASTIAIFDKSVAGSNNPFTPGATVPVGEINYTNNGGGSYTLDWNTSAYSGDGKSFEARVTANDGINPNDVVEIFNIDLAQDITDGLILARTLSNPLPWYGGNPVSPFTVAIEDTPAKNIGWIEAGEFVEYLINVPQTGTYQATFYAGKGNNGTLTTTLSADGTNIGSFGATNNGWQAYDTAPSPYVFDVSFANAGIQTLRLDFTGGGGINIRDFGFQLQTGNTAPQLTVVSPIDGNDFTQEDTVSFSATVVDNEQSGLDSSITWTSDVDGLLNTGDSFSSSSLSVGRHIITVSVSDGDTSNPLTDEETFTIYILPQCDQTSFRVNAGGPIANLSSADFEEDQSLAVANGTANTGTPSSYFTGTTDTTFGNNTALTSNTTGYPDAIFLTERYLEGNMTWAFPTGNGVYEVKLLFNENWTGEAGNNRIFDVVIEGNTELANYRPALAAGGINIAVVETVQATVTDDVLNIDFIQISQNPAIKGFDICFVSPLPTNNPPEFVQFVSPDSDQVLRDCEADGELVNLNATFTDTEDDASATPLSIEWFDGTTSLGTDNPLSNIALALGTHEITAVATDSGGESTTSDIRTVEVIGAPEFTSYVGTVGGAPLLNATINGPDITVCWDVANLDFGGSTGEHFHLRLDNSDNGQGGGGSAGGEPYIRIDVDNDTSGCFTFTNVAAGPHEISFYGAESGHNQICEKTIVPIIVEIPTQAPVFTVEIVDQTNIEGDSPLGLAVAANDPDGGTLTFSDDGTLPPGLTIDTNTGDISGSITAGAAANSPYAVVITAEDDETETATSTFNWTVESPAPFQLCVASGSTGLNAFGRTFIGDPNVAAPTGQGFIRSNGLIYADYGGSIAGTTSPGELLLFQKEIYAGKVAGNNANPPLEYSIPVTDGLYQVDLYFAEVFHENAGGRVFDVELEGNLILDEYDLVDIVKDGISSNQTAITRTYFVNVVDGSIEIGVGPASTDNGKISGFCITEVNSANLMPSTAIGNLSTEALTLAALSLNITDPEGDNLSVTLNGLPASLSYNASTKEIFGTPTIAQIGLYTINAIISDGTSSAITEQFELEITIPANDTPPTIDAIADINVNEGDVISQPITVVDDNDPSATIEIYDVSLGGTNNPFNPTTSVTGFTFSGTGGDYILDWTPTQGRSYLARVIANDGVNPAVIEEFRINVAQQISTTIAANTFNNPIPWYGSSNPGNGYSVAIEDAGNIGYIGAGEFVEYLVNVPAPGFYEATFSASNGSGANGSSTDLDIFEEGNTVAIGTITVPKNDWAVYANFTATVEFANAGVQTLQFEFDGGMNVQDFIFSPVTGTVNPIFTVEIANQTNLEGDSPQGLSVAANDPDGGTVTFSDNGTLPTGLIIDSNTGAISGTIAAGAAANSPYTVVITASDDEPETTTSTFSWTVETTTALPLCVNVGNQPAITAFGRTFTTDQYLTSAATDFNKLTSNFVGTVAGSGEEGLFQSENYNDPLTYAIPTGNGDFTVELYFAELYIGVSPGGGSGLGAGARVIDINVEGVTENGVDLFSEYGPLTAATKTYAVTVTDGILNIDLDAVADNAKLSGFCITETANFVANDVPTINIAPITDILDCDNEGEDFTLTANANDAEQGDLDSIIVWKDDLGSVVGTGATLDLTGITGSVTYTAEVQDATPSIVFQNITVNVVANTAPTLQDIIAAPTTIAPGEAISLSSIAADVEDDDTTLVVSWNSDLETINGGNLGIGSSITPSLTVEGNHLITASVTDACGITTTKTTTVSVNIIDITPPVITLTGANPQVIELGAGYTELGATTDDGSAVTIDASAFVDAVGSYDILYDATDGVNDAVQVVRVVNVVDTSIPVITLTGANPQVIELGAGYTELGATTDDGSAVTIDASAFVDAVGSYDILYDATDGVNDAVQVVRVVNVVDTSIPVITLTGANPQVIELGAGYTELGATTDDGSAVTIDASAFVDAVGSYDILYDATDGVNDAVQVVRVVNVVDTSIPVITLTGANPQVIELGAGYTELGATTDDGSAVTIDASAFVDAVGSYDILYDATDGVNDAVQVVRVVNVVDTSIPVITLTGANPQVIELGAGYTELGATTDDGSAVTIDASAFVDAVGSYDILYDATDGVNDAVQVVRVVNVVDTSIPVITLTGANPQVIELGAGYTELGATTDDGSAVTIDASAFVDAVGSYDILYDATDGVNDAVQVVRVVNVVDTSIPVITLNGANPQNILLGEGYTELGATTDDGSPVTIDASAFVDAIGSYDILYNATDGSNAAVQVTRTVNVYQDGVFLSIDPIMTNVGIGDSFEVNVIVESGLQQLDLAELHLSFNAAILEVSGITPNTDNLSFPLVPAAFDNTNGTIDYGAGTFLAPFPSGTFELLTISFEAIGSGTTNLAFVDPVGAANTIVTFGGADILTDTNGGTVLVDADPALEIIPNNIASTLLVGGTTVVSYVLDSNNNTILPSPANIVIIDGATSNVATWATTAPSVTQGVNNQVNFNANGLIPGTYNATLTASGVNGYDDVFVPVTLTVSPLPNLVFTPNLLNFLLEANQQDSGTYVLGTSDSSPLPQDLQVVAVDDATSTAPTWLTLNAGNNGFDIDTAGLAPGDYTAIITASGTNIVESTATVNLTVSESIPCARVAFDTGGNLPGSSTFGGGLFITNNSTGNVTITSVSIDLSTAVFPNMVFDPIGTAGDATAQCVTIISQTGGDGNVGLTIPGDNGTGSDVDCVAPFSGPNGPGGYNIMTLDFTDFEVGETVDIAVDVDPRSIEGFNSAGNAGAISGSELIGSTVTVTYSDGSTATRQLYQVGNSVVDSENFFNPASEQCAAPSLSLDGITENGAVNTTAQIATITGPANANIELLVYGTTLEDLGTNIPTDPFEMNKTQSLQQFSGVLNGSGQLNLPLDLTGLSDQQVYYIVATVIPAADNCGLGSCNISNVLRVKVDSEETVACARVAFDTGGNLPGSSTFGGGLFITNNSTGNVTITSVSIDLSTAVFPNMVFDPIGTAGDASAQCVTIISQTGGDGNVGLTIPGDNGTGSDVDCVAPFSGPNGPGGYNIMTLDFTDFEVGETVDIAVDVDPRSIEGFNSAGNAGAISGSELIGSTVTVTYSDGSTATRQLYQVGNSVVDSENFFNPASEQCAAPSLSLDGITENGAVNTTAQIATITGPANANIELLVYGTTLEDLGTNIPTDPFEMNKTQSLQQFSGVLNGSGQLNLPLDLTGLSDQQVYYIVATVIPAADDCGLGACDISNVLRIKVDTDAPVITLTGDEIVNLTIGDVYNEQGATATDNVDGSFAATVGGDFVDTGVADTYIVTYNASDSAGNSATEVVRTVNVSDGTTYVLGVENGSGDGSYVAGQVVDIVADAAPSGQQFAAWTGDIAFVGSLNSPSTTVTMPSSDVGITATYGPVPSGGTVWVEDFEDLANGTTVDNGSTAWSSSRNGGTFQVLDGRFWTNGTGPVGTWTSEEIAISGTVSVSVDVDDSDQKKEASDYLRAFYILDGGTPVEFGSVSGDIDAQTFTVGGLVGSSVRIVVESRVSGAPENYYIDNVAVMGGSTGGTTYVLGVENGSGDGSYVAGQVVDIVADAAPSGQQFAAWTGDIAFVGSLNSPSTTVTMPSSDVGITATYGPVPSGGTVWVEDFEDLANGTTVDNGSTAWSSSRNGGTFQVLDGRFWTNGTGPVGTWTSEEIAISGTVSVSVDVDDSDQKKEASDYLRAFYILDGGTPVEFGSVSGDIDAQTFTVGGLVGSSVRIVVESRVSGAPENYYIDNVAVMGGSTGGTTYVLGVENGSGDGSYVAGQVVDIVADAAPSGQQFAAWTGDIAFVGSLNSPSTTVTMPSSDVGITATYGPVPSGGTVWVEDFEDLANGTTVDNGSTAWSSSRNGGTFQVLDGRFWTNGTGPVGTWTSEEIAISGTVSVSVDVDDSDQKKEVSDYLRAFYILDGGTPVEFGSVSGDIDAQTFTVGGLVGSSVRIVVESRVSGAPENYYIDNVAVYQPSSSQTARTVFEPVNAMEVYPNPASVETTLRFQLPTTVGTIKIFDITGRLVRTVKGGAINQRGTPVNVMEMPTGVYFIKARNVEGQEFQEKMIIERQ